MKEGKGQKYPNINNFKNSGVFEYILTQNSEQRKHPNTETSQIIEQVYLVITHIPHS